MGGNYQGSVASGQATATPIDLSLSDAIQRGLKTNLGILTTSESVSSVSAQRRRVLSGLLPNLTGDYDQSYNRVNLAAEGFHFTLPPGLGFSIPTIVTFGSVDTRANLAQSVVNFQKWRNLKSSDVSVHAAQLSVQDSRDLVVEAVGNAYLLIISDMARVDAAQAQVDTSQVLFNRAVDQHTAGVAPAIDQLRAEVQLRTDQQTLLASKNQYERTSSYWPRHWIAARTAFQHDRPHAVFAPEFPHYGRCAPPGIRQPSGFQSGRRAGSRSRDRARRFGCRILSDGRFKREFRRRRRERRFLSQRVERDRRLQFHNF